MSMTIGQAILFIIPFSIGYFIGKHQPKEVSKKTKKLIYFYTKL